MGVKFEVPQDPSIKMESFPASHKKCQTLVTLWVSVRNLGFLAKPASESPLQFALHLAACPPYSALLVSEEHILINPLLTSGTAAEAPKLRQAQK